MEAGVLPTRNRDKKVFMPRSPTGSSSVSKGADKRVECFGQNPGERVRFPDEEGQLQHSLVLWSLVSLSKSSSFIFLGEN